jgi:hypothetical protein
MFWILIYSVTALNLEGASITLAETVCTTPIHMSPYSGDSGIKFFFVPIV